MTLDEAIKQADNLLEWSIEGMAPETEKESRQDIVMLEFVIQLMKNVRRKLMDLNTSPNQYREYDVKEITGMFERLVPVDS